MGGVPGPAPPEASGLTDRRRAIDILRKELIRLVGLLPAEGVVLTLPPAGSGKTRVGLLCRLAKNPRQCYMGGQSSSVYSFLNPSWMTAAISFRRAARKSG